MIFLFWVILGATLIAWSLTGGADLGAGLWDLLARGPRKQAQRAAVEHAIGPIWEANHIWLILVVVLLFSVFPRAFAAIGVAVHIPITLALFGLVLRGSAFVFRSYGLGAVGSPRVWGAVFAASSVLTPFGLGLALAALATGDVVVGPRGVTSGIFAGWTTPFAVLVGGFGVSLFAMLAAVFLAAETTGELSRDFIRRALLAEGTSLVLAAATAWRAAIDAPPFFDNLLRSPWSLGIQTLTALAALTTIGLLWLGQPRRARFSVGAQVALVVLGFGLAMDEHLVLPSLPITQAGARDELLWPLLVALAVGTVFLAPSLYTLFRVFKRSRPPA